MSALEELLSLASSRFNVPRTELSAAANIFDALGIDSIQAMEWLFDLEAHFKIEIDDYELRAVNDFASLAALIDRKRARP